MKIRVRENYCKGCSLCIELCPFKVLERSSKMNSRGYYFPVPVQVDKCSGCKICELTCPDLAIFIEKNCSCRGK